jgi:hypothetical protein
MFGRAGISSLVVLRASLLVRFLLDEADLAGKRLCFQKRRSTTSTATGLPFPRFWELIDDLLPCGPSIIIIIIYMVWQMESKTTKPLLDRLLDMLRSYGERKTIKLLLMSNGASHYLGQKLDFLEDWSGSVRPRCSAQDPGNRSKDGLLQDHPKMRLHMMCHTSIL